MTDKPENTLVTVFGGSGFLGRHVVRAFAKRGYRVRAAVRRPDLAGYLRPMGFPGQVQPIQANVRREYRWSVERAVAGADIVVNLVGVLSEGGRQTFAGVQTRGAETIADVCRAAGIANLVHVSAIGADAHSASGYARSKAAGEAAMLGLVPSATIIRPSIMFGPEDSFFNRFAAMARLAPALPLIGGGKTRFQPVYVGDVADAVVSAATGGVKPGTIIEAGGPEVRTFRECLEEMLTIIERKRLLLPLPFAVAGLIAKLTDWAPGAPITRDQIELLKHDNVVSDAAIAEGRTLAGLGISPDSLAAILPTYLWRYREHGQYRSKTA